MDNRLVATARDLDDEIRARNPKGHLWNACARLRAKPPKVRHQAIRGRHRVQITVVLKEWELESDVHWGWSQKIAEHFAARELLDELQLLAKEDPEIRQRLSGGPDLGDDLFEIDIDDVRRLRRFNAKGQLVEWCQGQKPPVRKPTFETRKIPDGGRWIVRGRLKTPKLTSPWFAAGTRKVAEHAAAEALLFMLREEDDLDVAETANPRSVLNKLVQQREISSCEVVIRGRSGPDHDQTFLAVGKATLHSGEVLETREFSGSPKKAVLNEAGAELLEQVEARLRQSEGRAGAGHPPVIVKKRALR